MSTAKERGSLQIHLTCLCEEGECVQAFHKGSRGIAAALFPQTVLCLTNQHTQVTVHSNIPLDPAVGTADLLSA